MSSFNFKPFLVFFIPRKFESKAMLCAVLLPEVMNFKWNRIQLSLSGFSRFAPSTLHLVHSLESFARCVQSNNNNSTLKKRELKVKKRGKKLRLCECASDFSGFFLPRLCVHTQLVLEFSVFFFLIRFHPQKFTLRRWMKGEMKLCFRAIGVCLSFFPPGFRCVLCVSGNNFS